VGGSTVSVFDTKADQLVGAPFAVGQQPEAVAITPDGSRAYVPNSTDSTISVIDTKTNAVVQTIPLATGAGPRAIAITPDGSRAYVVENVPGDVVVLDLRTNTLVGAPIPIGAGARGIAITPDGTRAYVVEDTDHDVWVIDTQNNTTVGSPIPLPVGSRPFGVAITPDGTRAYVTEFGAAEVSVISTATNGVIATPGVGSNPYGIGITPDGKRAYVVNDGADSVTAIDTVTNTTIGAPILLPGAGGPRGLAVSPNGAQAYAVAEGSRNTRVIDTSTNTQVAAIPTDGGGTPEAVAVVPDQPPRARFSAAGKGKLATFNAGASSDSDGTIASYSWDFGDGSSARTTTPTVRHAYVDAGEYRASVTLTDDDGCSTAEVFSGQTAYCNGSSLATASTTVASLALRHPKLDRRHGTATLTVSVPGPGTLALSGNGVVKQRTAPKSARAERKVSQAGTVKLKIRARGKAKRKLRHRGRAKVKFLVSFTPSGGSPNGQSQTVTLIKRHPHGR
jgi:YVTN family beta-propeller protein